MAEKLRPCPFCGGEANLTSDYSSEHDHTFYQVWHDCQTNPGTIRHSYGHALSLQVSTPWCANEEDAVRLWNRRAERTCRNASLDPECFKCSECGAEDYTSDSLTMWHEGGARGHLLLPRMRGPNRGGGRR